MIVDLYYTARPLIPRRLQIAMRRALVQRQRRHHREHWPIWEAAGEAPPQWPGWPDGKRFALVLTHDVEWASGASRCEQLAGLEEERGFFSAFGFVPGRYRTPQSLRDSLTDRGFEIMVHDLYHDGKLFRNRRAFEKCARQINRTLKEWGIRGFCAGAAHHHLPWISELDIDYDISTYDYDPFEPQPCGIGRIFPYWIQPPDHSGRALVEIPYTLPQDFTLFILMQEKSNAVWRQKLDWIAAKGGMALIKTHPDYMQFPGDVRKIDRYPIQYYTDLLDHVRERYGKEVWVTRPSEIAQYWRQVYSPGPKAAASIPSRQTFCRSCRASHAAGWLVQAPTTRVVAKLPPEIAPIIAPNR